MPCVKNRPTNDRLDEVSAIRDGGRFGEPTYRCRPTGYRAGASLVAKWVICVDNKTDWRVWDALICRRAGFGGSMRLINLLR